MAAATELGRYVWIPPKIAESASLEQERRVFSREELLTLHNKSYAMLLEAQHPTSGLYPAALKPHVEEGDHMGHSWIRDTNIVNMALLQPYIDLNPNQRNLATYGWDAVKNSLKGQLRLFAMEPWKEGFDQEVEVVTDAYGRKFTRLTKNASPIHLKPDGTECEWPEQDQPDSLGFFLLVFPKALNYGMELTKYEEETLNAVVRYMLRINVMTHEQTAMWEWSKVHDPAPLSSVALATQGLKNIAPFMESELREPIERAVLEGKSYVAKHYPYELTCKEGHLGKTDLATLVAMGHGALDYVDHAKYFSASDPELRIDGCLGSRRYKGDHWYRGAGDPEAQWLLGDLYRAKLEVEMATSWAKIGDLPRAKNLKEKALFIFRNVIDAFNEWGYKAELLYYKDGVLIPNNNHLLWNDALVVSITSQALHLSDLLDET